MDNVNRRRRRRLIPINTEIRSTAQSLHLPEETIEEVLLRLPVKSLLRFKCVSKPWRSLLSSQRFIKIQFENSTKNTSLDHHRVIFNGKGRSNVLKQCSLQPLLDEPSLDPSPIFDPSTHRRKTGDVMGHCNGLLCILKLGLLFLWNPATRITIKLPKTTSIYSKKSNFGFGWDEASGAYKVVVTVDYRIVEVYSSKTNSWNRIENNDIGFGILYGRAEFVGRKLHWLGGDARHNVDYIVTLDMKSETFGKMELPCGGRMLPWRLVALRGFLSFAHHTIIELGLWVMKEYGVKESWVKVITIPFIFEPVVIPKSVIPLYMGLNGEILLFCESTFLVYNPHEDVSSLPMEIKRLYAQRPLPCYPARQSVFVYVESLASPFTSSQESQELLDTS